MGKPSSKDIGKRAIYNYHVNDSLINEKVSMDIVKNWYPQNFHQKEIFILNKMKELCDGLDGVDIRMTQQTLPLLFMTEEWTETKDGRYRQDKSQILKRAQNRFDDFEHRGYITGNYGCLQFTFSGMLYWKYYSISNYLKKFIEVNVDKLSVEKNNYVTDNFAKDIINAKFEDSVLKKLLPVLPMKTFDLDVEQLPENILAIMVECNYFGYTIEYYQSIAERNEDIAVEYIVKNQAEFYNSLEDFPMTKNVLERLLFEQKIPMDNREELFEKYAKTYMTEKIALNMNAEAEAWSYEKEWRIVTENYSRTRSLEVDPKTRYVLDLKENIKAFYLGAKINEKEKSEIIQFAKKNNRIVYQMILSANTYELRAERIDNV